MILRNTVTSLLSLTLCAQTVSAQTVSKEKESRAKDIAHKYAAQVKNEEQNFKEALDVLKGNLIDLRANIQEARNSSVLLNYNVAAGITSAAVYAANIAFFYKASNVAARAASATRYGADVAQFLILTANITTMFGNSSEVVDAKAGIDELIEALENLKSQASSSEEENAITNLVNSVNDVKRAESPRETMVSNKRLMAAFSSFLLAAGVYNGPSSGVAKTKREVVLQASFILSAAVVTILSGLDEHDEKVLQEKIDKVISAIEATQADLNN